MQTRNALAAFSALSHPVRLALFRTLTARAPEGVPAGELATEFDAPPSTMTGHLQTLERAGLVSSQRRSRQVLYALEPKGARELITFLTQECCGGRPDLCGPYQGLDGALSEIET